MPLHRRGDLNALPALGFAVRDRRHQQLRSLTDDGAGDDHHDRPVLPPFFLALVRFVRPQIGVAEDVSRLGRLP